jgi:chitinase
MALEARMVPANFTVDYVLTNDWVSGYQASVKVTNLDSTPVTDWKLEFDYASNISSLWDAQLSSHVGNHYLVAAPGWTKDIPAKGSVTFGFVAAPGTDRLPPTNYKLNGQTSGGTTPAPTLPALSVSSPKVAEGNSGGTSTLDFVVSLSAASTQTVTVNYATSAGTASEGTDYTKATGTLTFNPGETTKTVKVAVIGDTVVEGDETLTLKLSSPVGATLKTDTGTGTITNDDTAPPPPSAGGAVKVEITSDWGSGYTANVTITNTTTATLNPWQLGWTFDGQVTSIWNAKVAARSGESWTVSPESWNGSIAPGASVSFGFNGTPGAKYKVPTNFILNGSSTGGGGGGGVTTPNRAPSAVADSAWVVAGSKATISVLANDTDPDGDKLTVKSATAGAYGSTSVQADGTVLYTPGANFSGSDSFTYTVSDPSGLTSSASVSVNLLADAVKAWPGQVFAPYVDTTLWPTLDMAKVASEQGLRYFSLGFITATAANKPAWGGFTTYEVDGQDFDLKMRAQISSIRALGGDVNVSFGGAANQEMAEVLTDKAALKAAYLQVINTYDLKRIDFDIEGGALANKTVIDRRSAVLSEIQADMLKAGKPLEIWLTLPVLPTGLTADGLYAVNSAFKAGVRLGGVNIMAMDYGDSAAPNPAGKMGDYAIQAATSLQGQLKQIYAGYSDAKLWSMVGITPMIGMNDVTTEVFDQQEAREVMAFAQQKAIGKLSFWSLNRDLQSPKGVLPNVDNFSSSILQTPYEFSGIFKPFTSSSTGGGSTTPVTPSLSVANVTVTEGNTGTASMDFRVTLSQAASTNITFTVNTADGTATAGSDYQALVNKQVTIAAGQTSAVVSVTVNGDTAVEANESLTLLVSGATGATIATASASGTITNDDTAPAPNPGSGGSTAKKRVVSYFVEWGIYGRNYTVADLPVDKITTVNYAFAKITDAGEVGIFDSWAAVEKPFGPDTWDTPIRGNYGALKRLKDAHPNLEVMISIGGWTLSDKFSDVALTPASREKFAASCVAFCKQYGFDGVDLDWEYPVSGGLDSNKYRPEDKQNYTLLVKEIRRQFDLQEAADGKQWLISIASPAGYDKYVNFEMAELAKTLDWINIMTYDYHGSWENTTNHQAALYADPSRSAGLDGKYNISYTVDMYLRDGIDPAKLNLGAPLYGRTWAGVGSTNNGLYQPSTGAGSGTWEKGVIDYSDLASKLKNQPDVYKLYWDEAAQAPYVYAPSIEGGWFSTFENKQSLGKKIDLIMEKGLGGMMFWEADADIRDASSPDSLTGYAASRLL